jgi:hypothetical protein
MYYGNREEQGKSEELRKFGCRAAARARALGTTDEHRWTQIKANAEAKALEPLMNTD